MNSSKHYLPHVPKNCAVEMVESISDPKSTVKVEDQDDCNIIDISKVNSLQESAVESDDLKPRTLSMDIDNNQTRDCTIIIDDDVVSRKKPRNKIFKLPKILKTKLKQDLECNGVSDKEFCDQGSSRNGVSNLVNNAIGNTIVIEDFEKDNDGDIIECATTKNTQYEAVDGFKEILEKEKVLAEVIEICLDMENSSGMLRIINRTVIPIYKKTSEEFRKSHNFQKSLTNAVINLKTDPTRKFTHLKAFCEFMKNGVSKKRVKLTTLETNLKGKNKNVDTNISSSTERIPMKKQKFDVIDLDDDDSDNQVTEAKEDTMISENSNIQTSNMEIITDTTSDIINEAMDETKSNVNKINISEYDSSTNDLKVKDEPNGMQIIIEDVRSEAPEEPNSSEYNNNVKMKDSSSTKDVLENYTQNKGQDAKKNLGDENDIIVIDDENDNSNKENISAHSTVETNQNSIDDKHHNNTQISPLESTDVSEDELKKLKIQHIEASIKEINDMIRELEEKEVDWDEHNNELSPYVVCEHYKSQLTNLYKNLCKLTGTEPFKRRKVRLKVAEGHHEGPVRFLENFINSKIDENGNPPFPDMQDVINCVTAANMFYNIGWMKKDIDKEARSLFLHFGRTVQKSRQKREWRHLMRYAKKQAVDPADEEPELQAKLEENAKIALSKEMDLLAKYVEMDNNRSMSNEAGTSGAVEEESYCDISSIPDTAPIPAMLPENNSNGSRKLPKACIQYGNEMTHNNKLQINSYHKSCSGQITDNIHMYKALPNQNQNVVTLPAHVIAVSNQIIPIVYCTETFDANGILRNPMHNEPMLPSTNEQNRCDENQSTNEDSMDVDNNIVEREMLEIEIDMKPNIEHLNSEINHTNAEGNKSCTEFVNNNSAAKDNVTAIESNMAQYNHISTNYNMHITNDISRENTETSITTVYTHKTRDTDKNTHKAIVSNVDKTNTEESREITEIVSVKKEPLDIPRMLAALGNNFTVSIVDIEDPFEVIEISDSSDSEDEDSDL